VVLEGLIIVSVLKCKIYAALLLGFLEAALDFRLLFTCSHRKLINDIFLIWMINGLFHCLVVLNYRSSEVLIVRCLTSLLWHLLSRLFDLRRLKLEPCSHLESV